MSAQTQAQIANWVGFPPALRAQYPDLWQMLVHILSNLIASELAAVIAVQVDIGTIDPTHSCCLPGQISYRPDIELVNFAGGTQTLNELGLEVLHELGHIILQAAGASDTEDAVNWWTWDNCARFGLRLPGPPPCPRPK